MEWPKPLSVRSSVTTSASVRARMHRPSSTSYQLGLITTTRFTPTRHSDIVHHVSSSQLTEVRDRVRSFGGYNIYCLDKSAGWLFRPTTRFRSGHFDWSHRSSYCLRMVSRCVSAAVRWTSL